MSDDTSDTDEIPVAQRTEVEHKPRLARTIRVLALPIVVFWVLLAVGVNVFVPQLEKVAEEVSVPLSPSDAPSVTGMKHIGEKFKEYDSDNLVLVTLVGDKPLGQDAHRYYDELVNKLQQDHEHVEHALNFWAALHVVGCRELRPQGRLRPGQPARRPGRRGRRQIGCRGAQDRRGLEAAGGGEGLRRGPGGPDRRHDRRR
ncbi:hypothetical protein HMPREF0591_3603 [Mycobacterium parascrofulaceum ATCC BAA-614]|uniref:Membrane transport protein MMPL domain-containing protein n=1 Tax=Mycobacterium parascrofulaceum ATCC BAA-614 TaxID=525368 RepID=D5PBQ9_9MYCO|nr:hypothetical protein HMPREF0591_3603 [Mycobacterium parascrofulaceum ATCC BAA-614]